MFGRAWEVEFSYFYSVEGEECSGWFHCDLWEEGSAKTLLELYPRNAPVPVRYNPTKRDVSVVLLEDLRLNP